MARHRIVCTEQEPRSAPHDAAHIIAVGTGSMADKAEQRWTLDQVLNAIKEGNQFYTVSPSTGKEANVSKYECRGCGRSTIRSGADSVTDNNLDNLRQCRGWS